MTLFIAMWIVPAATASLRSRKVRLIARPWRYEFRGDDGGGGRIAVSSLKLGGARETESLEVARIGGKKIEFTKLSMQITITTSRHRKLAGVEPGAS
ncbi:MAG: hypothetical protein EXS31_00370 [Pedosphaera sp.]|nr:hypothetical protein [Pedosphaera sp.]